MVLALGLRVIAGAVSGVSKTRGLELPVAERVPSRAIVQGCLGAWWSGDASVTMLTEIFGKCVEGKKQYHVVDRELVLRSAINLARGRGE